IGTKIPAFYREKYPEIASAHGDQVQQMVRETQAIFKRSIFPEMQVDWRTHPDNVGHFYFNGCFRCHDGNHVSKDGKVISKDCNSCHTVLGQEESGVPIEAVANVNFKHPVDLGDMTAVNCSDCHGAQAAQ
ncbi:MAG TPA: cytochrome c3 family protein, partial [Candidatus Acidoferrales bacterium]|nr:cytochrome c3 family protein [Candidatus Acidoferrales bacterium]